MYAVRNRPSEICFSERKEEKMKSYYFLLYRLLGMELEGIMMSKATQRESKYEMITST